jgi:hypothetical protein
MKRLIVCNDGTWNTPDQEDNGIPSPTNVFKIYNAIADNDGNTKQLKYYHPGVGSEGGLAASVLGGAVGVGISRHIQSAYHWLGTNYDDGDEIYLFGFSRGAFTARSIGGLLGRGLLDLHNLDPKQAWARVKAAYDAYRQRNSSLENRDWAGDDWQFFHGTKASPVRFIGVWDTVGALGVPDDLEILDVLFDNKDKWRFHDTDLGDHVACARHAMAIDEVRSSFTITRWNNAAKHADAKEVWFPGVHCDVGGGYADSDLSDGALQWMIEESSDVGLKFRPGVLASLHPNPLGAMHNSFKGAFAKLRSRPRNVDALKKENKDRFHKSAVDRHHASPIAYPPYRPTQILDVNEPFDVDVYADTRWNDTGLFLESGHSYVFSATGEWLDSKDACDWHGTEDDDFTVGDMVRKASSALGMFEEVFQKLTRNESTDFLGTKRVEALKWFTLVGAITNDAGTRRAVKSDGSPVPHQCVALPKHETKPLKIEHPGYLCCFANDVWSLYGNNHGSIRMTVMRVA